MNYVSPESCGVKTEAIIKFIERIENEGLATHDVIFTRGNNIFFEAYWKPFDKNYLHRQYSVTKSVVAIAVGFLLKDGLISLDDPIEKYFQDKITGETDANLRRQTIRNMLTMTTALPAENWFKARSDDRVRFYFENKNKPSVKGGTLFKYDSSGTFVIGALVERLSGKSFIGYMREKLFDKIGVSQGAACLKCPGGHSWSDSALICTAHDLLKIARFTLNFGEWNGEQILDREYLEEATSPLVINNYIDSRSYESMGYGYYFWHDRGKSFSFNGMGCQFALCIPETDMIMIYHGDNQGNEIAKKIIFDSFYELISDAASETAIEENSAESKKLEKLKSGLILCAAKGKSDSGTAAKINGKEYVFSENRMGLKNIRFEFGKENIMYYENEQGKKKLVFGICENAFSEFEQDGYSDEIGSQKGERRYKCAASASWLSENMLYLKTQIIDTYFGNIHTVFSFDGDTVSIESEKTAEDFLNEYEGRAFGIQK